MPQEEEDQPEEKAEDALSRGKSLMSVKIRRSRSKVSLKLFWLARCLGSSFRVDTKCSRISQVR